MRLRRIAVYAVLAALYLLHNDLWLWNETGLVAGLPAGLAYHAGYCLAAAAALAALVRWAWPETGDEAPADGGGE